MLHTQAFKSLERSRGFTLIELVAVIIILSIISIGVTNFIGTSTQIYIDTAERDEILAKSRYTVERLNRSIRYGLPNSLRVTSHTGTGGDVESHCLELVPIEWSTFYLEIATGADSGVNSIEGPNMVSALNRGSDTGDYNRDNAQDHYVVVYPTDPEQVYVSASEILDGDGRIVGLNAVRDSATAGLVEVEFDNAMTFDEESTVERFYIVSRPVSYCLVFENLIDSEPRYNLYMISGYDFQVTQTADMDELIVTLGGNAVLMAEDIANDIRAINNVVLQDTERDFDASPFRVSDASLQRNSIVHTLLMFERNDEVVVFNNEIHLRNSP